MSVEHGLRTRSGARLPRMELVWGDGDTSNESTGPTLPEGAVKPLHLPSTTLDETLAETTLPSVDPLPVLESLCLVRALAGPLPDKSQPR